MLKNVKVVFWSLMQMVDEITLEFIQDELEEANNKIDQSIELITRHGGHDGEHHKDWCLDQVFWILTGDQYDEIISGIKESGYDWNVGIAP